MFNIILLGLTSFFTDVSSEMIYPLVPFFLTLKLGASPAVMGLIEGIAESVASLLKIFARLHFRPAQKSQGVDHCRVWFVGDWKTAAVYRGGLADGVGRTRGGSLGQRNPHCATRRAHCR